MSQLATARVVLNGPTITELLNEHWRPAAIDFEPAGMVGLLDWTRPHPGHPP